MIWYSYLGFSFTTEGDHRFVHVELTGAKKAKSVFYSSVCWVLDIDYLCDFIADSGLKTYVRRVNIVVEICYEGSHGKHQLLWTQRK